MLLVYRVTLPGRVTVASSRAQTGSGSNAHIMGLVFTGAKPKSLLLRGVGPTLASFGVATPVADPVLTIYNSGAQPVFTNDNWNDSPELSALRSATAATGAFVLPEASKDAAGLLTLDPGAYTVHVSSASAAGISLIEAYEVP